MGNDKKFRALAIAAICVAIVGVSIAYAALSASLSIDGTATVNTESSWKIAWTGIKDKKTSGYSSWTSEPTVSGSTISWEANFTAPGDSVSFTATVTNSGTINATLLATSQFIKVIDTDSIASNFDYSFTLGGTSISELGGKVLMSNASKDIVVTVTLKDMKNDDFANLNGKSIKFNLGLEWEQASGTIPAENQL